MISDKKISTADTLKSVALDKDLHDPSKLAEAFLDDTIESEKSENKLKSVAIEEARSGKKVINKKSGRQQSRILFVTEDQSYLEKNSKSTNEMKLLAVLFDEVHIFVLTTGNKKEDAMRVTENMWVYRPGTSFWGIPYKSVSYAKENLFFNDYFRPDLVVALEPYTSGLSSWAISKKFNRPLQTHVKDDFLSPLFLRRDKKNSNKKRIAKFVIKASDSIRTGSASIKESLESKIKKLPEIKILPRFYNFSLLMKTEAASDLHDVYKDFVFIILAFAPLKIDSPLQDVFSALHNLLQNPRVGLVVVGDGPALNLYEEKAEILGISKNVVFKKVIDDKVSYLKTADLLVETDTTKSGDDIIFEAAACGLPIVMYETELRKDLFKDGESASFCLPGDTYALDKEVRNFLNNPSLRKQYSTNGQYVVKSRLQEDEVTYYKAYRDSIETGILIEE